MRKFSSFLLFLFAVSSQGYAIPAVLGAYSFSPYSEYPGQVNVSDEDAELTEKIRKELSKGSRNQKYANVIFYVSYGNVILEGTVETLDDKNQIRRDILPIQGVRQIDNRIIVQPPIPKYK